MSAKTKVCFSVTVIVKCLWELSQQSPQSSDVHKLRKCPELVCKCCVCLTDVGVNWWQHTTCSLPRQYSVFGDLNGRKHSQCCHCDRKQQKFELEIQMISFELTGEFSHLSCVSGVKLWARIWHFAARTSWQQYCDLKKKKITKI